MAIISRFLIMFGIFLIFYENLPALFCRLNSGLYHWAGFINCNTLAEEFVGYSSLAVIFLAAWRLRKYKLNIAFPGFFRIKKVVFTLSLISTLVVALSTFFIFARVGFNLVADGGGRSYLVYIYHETYGNALVLPFIYAAISLSFARFFILKKKYLYFANIFLISFGCYLTLSRGLLLAAILPYILFSRKPRVVIMFLIFGVLIFFSRDILNGQLASSLAALSVDNSDFISANFGEIFNTFFGRRVFVDSVSSADHLSYVTYNLVRLTGVYYVLYPIFKFATFLDIPLVPVDPVLIVNARLESLTGLNGWAGTYSGDFVFYGLVALVINSVSIVVVYSALLARKGFDLLKFFFYLFAVMMIPSAFRWSFTAYFSMLSGLCIVFSLLLTLRPITSSSSVALVRLPPDNFIDNSVDKSLSPPPILGRSPSGLGL